MKSITELSFLKVILVLACLGGVTEGVSAQTYQQLWAPDGKVDAGFGLSVSGWKDVIVIGAWFHDNLYGAAYVYRKSGGQWLLDTKLQASDRQTGDRMGTSVSIYGDLIVSGAHLEDHDSLVDAGAAYVYRWDGTQWNEEAKLTASDGVDNQHLGWSVAAGRDIVAVGAPAHNTLVDTGSVYIFRKVAGTWIEEAKLLPSGGSVGDEFGIGVYILDDRVFSGAMHYSDKGALFVYHRSRDGIWTEEAKLMADDGQNGDELGYIVSAHGDRVATSARHHHGDGACYIFRRTGTTWTQEGKVEPTDKGRGDWFGQGVSIRGDKLAVGSIFNEGSGSTYLYAWNGSAWTVKLKLHDPSLHGGSRFGHSVTIQDDYFVVGASQCGGKPGLNIGPGTAYVYDEDVDWTWCNYGTGWPGTHGVPELKADTSLPPFFSISIGNSRGISTAGFLICGPNRTKIPTPLGGELLVVPSLLVALSPIPPAGATFTTVITNPPLEMICLQVVELDEGASQWFSFTPGLKLTF
ncbi:MAG: hypothetical protein ACYTG7_20920 [Planctomycetota bacterium]|jgi:hypothetical protein